ncbi:hypothetical protein [Fervidibacillus albus]|uniref:Uncharacterized protein n=1 Tax=Fervidibacillus albus TaxID=2980026 RepID=A0A9E8LV29_9BACI|nr:hypothetical protein [Fervidibacillus albus]WAA10011.1 hypothetical protein OE104_01150 [Fervidibacillus albus]
MRKQILYSFVLFLFLFFTAWMINENDKKQNVQPENPSKVLQINYEKEKELTKKNKQFEPREYVKLKTENSLSNEK